MWPTFMLLLKALFYSGAAGTIGAAFCLWLLRGHQPMRRMLEYYGVWASLLALVAAVTGFFFQVGFTAGGGLEGMANWGLAQFLWASPVGAQMQWRLLGLTAALVAFLVGVSRSGRTGVASRALLAAGLAALIYSFVLAGHTAQAGVLQRIALLLHVATAGIWIGSLLPLFWFAGRAEQQQVADRLQRFGQIALGLVGLLLFAGLALLLTLPGSVGAIFSSTWGGALIFKLALVAILLALAAQNKLSLVPAIRNGEPVQAFRLTAVFEMLFALLILLVTAAVTTITALPA